MKDLQFIPVGDTAVRIEVGQQITPIVNKKVHSLAEFLREGKMEEIVEIVPSYQSLTIYYKAHQIRFKEMKSALNKRLASFDENVIQTQNKEIIVFPVAYGGDFGPDLERVAEINNISIEDVIHYHSSKDYLIYMIGFLPGFPYLGGMSERIETPRLAEPRLRVEAGAVGIGGKQTGVYPIESPGGWNLIGKTPLKLFNPKEENSVLLKAGQYIRFKPVNKFEYKEIEKSVKAGSYMVERLVESDE